MIQLNSLLTNPLYQDRWHDTDVEREKKQDK